MLKNINPILGPELLAVLRAMGHGDEIAIVDGNYPAASAGPKLIRMDGHDTVTVLDAVLSVMPLDDFVPDPAIRMEVVGDPDKIVPITNEFSNVLKHHEPGAKLAALERFTFYERVRQGFAVIATGERRLYGNIILKKGVIRPAETT
jgi:L-fucose mutarotase